jgi:hypothetical protein
MDTRQYERRSESGAWILADKGALRFGEQSMYILYTSTLNPKGENAKKLMGKFNVQFREIIIDLQNNSELRKRAETLLQIFLQRTTVSVTLPFLTQEQNGEEQVVLLGFVSSEWESFFQLQNPLTPTIGAASITSPSTPEFPSELDLAHLPVVGAEESVRTVEEKPLQ